MRACVKFACEGVCPRGVSAWGLGNLGLGGRGGRKEVGGGEEGRALTWKQSCAKQGRALGAKPESPHPFLNVAFNFLHSPSGSSFCSFTQRAFTECLQSARFCFSSWGNRENKIVYVSLPVELPQGFLSMCLFCKMLVSQTYILTSALKQRGMEGFNDSLEVRTYTFHLHPNLSCFTALLSLGLRRFWV